MNQESIKSALHKMDSSKGIKISDLVRTLGHRPSTEMNKTFSKILLSLNWKKGTTRYRASDKSLFYLWYAPVITTVQIENSEYEQLQRDNWTKDSKIHKLEELVAELKQEKLELTQALDGYIFGQPSCKEQAEIQEDRILRSKTPEPVSVPLAISPATPTSSPVSSLTQSQLDKLTSQFRTRFQEPLSYILQNWKMDRDKRVLKVRVDFRLDPNAPDRATVNQVCSGMFGKDWLKIDSSNQWVVSGYLAEVLEDSASVDQMSQEDMEDLERMVG